MLSRQLLRRDIDLRSIVEEFGKLIYEEIDYLQEARNAQRFADLYGNNPTVYVPRIYWRYSKSKLLVMEWIDGERLTSPLLREDVKTKLVSAMVQCSLQQMLEKGFFHADPHGGNLLATADGKLVYLDFGMMSEVVGYQRYGILEAVIHLVNRDFRSLCQLYVRLGFIPPGFASPPTILSLPFSPCYHSLNDHPVMVSLSGNGVSFWQWALRRSFACQRGCCTLVEHGKRSRQLSNWGNRDMPGCSNGLVEQERTWSQSRRRLQRHCRMCCQPRWRRST